MEHGSVLWRFCILGANASGIEQAARDGDRIFPRRLDPGESPSAYRCWLDDLYRMSWNVYSQPPFGGAEGGLEYLGRYTHRVAISNSGLLRIDDSRVVFRYKDYRDDGRVKRTSLEGVEFLRRYLMHLLPLRFQRIRSYGLWANRHRTGNLQTCRRVLGWSSPAASLTEQESEKPSDAEERWSEEVERLTGLDPRRCPICGQGRLLRLDVDASRAEKIPRTARAPP